MSRGRAVVLGASMAGLCAARVLADRFDEVVIVDPDLLEPGSDPRPHVPQGRHPHLLLPSGARLLEGWFPGLEEELERRGATRVDLCADIYWHQHGGVARRPGSSLHAPSMTRPLLEDAVRCRLRDHHPRVRFRAGVAASGLLVEAGRVVGARLASGAVVQCDLLLDATGRSAHTERWLTAVGYEPAPVSDVRVDTRYVTRFLRSQPDPHRDWKAAAVIGDPESCLLAMVLPVEGHRWLLVTGGLNGESGPVSDADLVPYLRSMASPVIADLAARTEILSEAVTYRFPDNRRRHVERLRRFPLGWLPIGDAVCSFDPIYGQGISSAAMQADALARVLDRTDGLLGEKFSRRYFKAVARVVEGPWSIAAGGDFAYPRTSGDKPLGTGPLNWYVGLVTRASQVDDGVALRLNAVISLVRDPTSLLGPVFAVRVMRGARRAARRRGSTPRAPRSEGNRRELTAGAVTGRTVSRVRFGDPGGQG